MTQPEASIRFLAREQQLVARLGIRKPDSTLQTLRCPVCGREALRIRRYLRRSARSVELVERRMLEAVQQEVKMHCPGCRNPKMHGDGRLQEFLIYSERLEAHLGVRLELIREDTGRIRVRRSLWFLPNEGEAETIAEDDERLESFWLDSSIRAGIGAPDGQSSVEALTALCRQHANDYLAPRELAYVLQEIGRIPPALEAFEASLKAHPDQPDVLRRAGLLYASWGQPIRGSELLIRAHDLTGDAELLPAILRVAYQGRRLGALSAAAQELLSWEPESVSARKALVCTQSASDVDEFRDAWIALERAACQAGERSTASVAAHWVDVLGHPWPHWEDGLTREGYRSRIVEELRELGYRVDVDPPPVEHLGAIMKLDLDVETPGGERLRVMLTEALPRQHVCMTLRATLRAILDESDMEAPKPVLLAAQPQLWQVMRMVTGVPEVLADIRADVDPSMVGADENVADFLQLAETQYGRTLAFEVDRLEDVDEILLRMHDDGFGGASFAIICQAAAYIAAVIARQRPETEWIEGNSESDPYVLQLYDGSRINLVSKIRKLVHHGETERLEPFVTRLLDEIPMPGESA